MSAQRLSQMDQPSVFREFGYSPEHLRHKNGRMPSHGDMAGDPDHSFSYRDRSCALQAMGKKAVEVTAMVKKPGRPTQSSNVQAIPIFRYPPDLQKLGRAVLRLAAHLESQEKAEAANKPLESRDEQRRDNHAA